MKTFLILVALIAASCSTTRTSRSPTSTEPDLTGTRLGVAHYKLLHKGANEPAVRLYLNRIEGEPGAYHAVLFEYIRVQAIGPQYLIARKLPSASKYAGYLNAIGKRISAYKMVPGAHHGSFALYPVKVVGDKIEADLTAKPTWLTLSSEASSIDPLGGATIAADDAGQPSILFPKDDGKFQSAQYTMAKAIYDKAKLDSTWRKEFLTGQFLAAYLKTDDVVLTLSTQQGAAGATFINNDAKFKLSAKRRAAVFTSPKSAALAGDYRVSEPVDGMFVLSPTQENQPGAENVVGRIGLFLDVFDATKSRNEDVVELAFINPGDPEDFLMYYEHPDNGEGAAYRK